MIDAESAGIAVAAAAALNAGAAGRVAHHRKRLTISRALTRHSRGATDMGRAYLGIAAVLVGKAGDAMAYIDCTNAALTGAVVGGLADGARRAELLAAPLVWAAIGVVAALDAGVADQIAEPAGGSAIDAVWATTYRI